MCEDESPSPDDEPGAWPLKPGVTLANRMCRCWSGGSLLAAAPPLLLPPPVAALRIAAMRRKCLSCLFDMCRLENGTWTTTKPGRALPLNQPAPPPGFANVVPKKCPRIDMYTCPALA